jgi:hypothetical protein
MYVTFHTVYNLVSRLTVTARERFESESSTESGSNSSGVEMYTITSAGFRVPDWAELGPWLPENEPKEVEGAVTTRPISNSGSVREYRLGKLLAASVRERERISLYKCGSTTGSDGRNTSLETVA